MAVEDTIRIYDEIVTEAKELLRAKDHDYGESWRDMRISSITDQILVKIKRVQTLEGLSQKGEQSKVAEGRESEYRDIMNYCVFAIIKLREEMQEKENSCNC